MTKRRIRLQPKSWKIPLGMVVQVVVILVPRTGHIMNGIEKVSLKR